MSLLQTVWRSGMDLVLPPCCVLCHRDMEGQASAGICEDCRKPLTIQRPPRCVKCAMPQTVGTGGDCPHCRGRRFAFASVRCVAPYEGAVREAVLRAKTLAGESIAAALGGLLAESLAAERPPAAETDLVTAVPSHWLRRLRRGTNSAAVMAQVVSQRLEIPLAADLLVCRRNIQKQSGLNTYERRRNVRGAFRTSWGYDIQGAVVLLVDDVLTTGATAQEVARLLRRRGAARVDVAIVARAEGPDW